MLSGEAKKHNTGRRKKQVRKAKKESQTQKGREIMPTNCGGGEEPAARLSPPPSILTIMQIMKDEYQTSPRGLWGLSRSTDVLAPRGFVIDNRTLNLYRYRQYYPYYPIVRVRISVDVDFPITIKPGVRAVSFDGGPAFKKRSTFNRSVDFPVRVEEIHLGHGFNQPVV